jgi:dTDP-4-dehydrorhamnose 3,5-epimerase
MHAIKQSDPGFAGFGEAYFSSIHAGAFKGWKKHLRMTLNIIVPVGAIRFFLVDQRAGQRVHTIDLSPDHYGRLTVPPGIWMGFKGMGEGQSILLNVASIEHDPTEAENRERGIFASLFPELQAS